jgi:hypothetical protein
MTDRLQALNGKWPKILNCSFFELQFHECVEIANKMHRHQVSLFSHVCCGAWKKYRNGLNNLLSDYFNSSNELEKPCLLTKPQKLAQSRFKSVSFSQIGNEKYFVINKTNPPTGLY